MIAGGLIALPEVELDPDVRTLTGRSSVTES